MFLVQMTTKLRLVKQKGERAQFAEPRLRNTGTYDYSCPLKGSKHDMRVDDHFLRL